MSHVPATCSGLVTAWFVTVPTTAPVESVAVPVMVPTVVRPPPALRNAIDRVGAGERPGGPQGVGERAGDCYRNGCRRWRGSCGG